ERIFKRLVGIMLFPDVTGYLNGLVRPARFGLYKKYKSHPMLVLFDDYGLNRLMKAGVVKVFDDPDNRALIQALHIECGAHYRLFQAECLYRGFVNEYAMLI